MKNLSQKGYTTEQVLNALRGKYGSRNIRFRYLLLDAEERVKDELYEVESASVEMQALADIKRTASFRLRDLGTRRSVMRWQDLGPMDWSDLDG